MTCVACGEELEASDRFCEACGTPLEGTDSDATRRLVDLGRVAAVSDRGLRRARNEDAFSISAGPGGSAVVVCDGVATTERSGDAAVTAASAARVELDRGLSDPDGWVEAVARSVEAAQDALCARSPGGRPLFDGCTTIVAALIRPGRVVVANVGDSRAYWVGRHGSGMLLTTDDSWVREALAAGLPDKEVRASGRAHELTGWLGVDAGAVAPHVAEYRPADTGLVVVCTDGLWNYAEAPQQLASLVGNRAGAANVAGEMVAFALERGGEDNVTVAVAEVPDKESSE
jgi:serine/threonine protein phosphatase PrpC